MAVLVGPRDEELETYGVTERVVDAESSDESDGDATELDTDALLLDVVVVLTRLVCVPVSEGDTIVVTESDKEAEAHEQDIKSDTVVVVEAALLCV